MMDYNDYKKHMDDHNLIESPESVQNLVNAIRVNENIKNIKALTDSDLNFYDRYSLDPRELLGQFMKDKDFYIQQAIKKAYSVEWAEENFKPFKFYQMQINELKTNMQPTVASTGIIDLENQMGVE